MYIYGYKSNRGTNREPQNKGNLIHQTLYETCKRPFVWALEPCVDGIEVWTQPWLLLGRGYILNYPSLTMATLST